MFEAFAYKGGVLYAEGNDLSRLAERVGTPFYCYSATALRARTHAFQTALDRHCSPHAPLTAFAVKANGALGVLRVLEKAGTGADIVSGGELARALRAGVAPDKIIFSGVGKTDPDIEAALRAQIAQFNVESAQELRILNDLAAGADVIARVALRVNPDIAAGAHPHISTGKRGDKFGVSFDDALPLYAEAARLSHIAPKGFAVHIGSQITAPEPFCDGFAKLTALARAARAEGLPVSRLDFGGGLGVAQAPGAPQLSFDAYAQIAGAALKGLDVEAVFEPGRALAANAGVLVARVLYVKGPADRPIVILDAGMNDLMRPALYGAEHLLQPVRRTPETNTAPTDVVGPVCETTDAFLRAADLPPLARGDLVAFLQAGAYGAALASEYNARPRIAEVMVEGARAAVIRRRAHIADMIALETMPEWADDG